MGRRRTVWSLFTATALVGVGGVGSDGAPRVAASLGERAKRRTYGLHMLPGWHLLAAALEVGGTWGAEFESFFRSSLLPSMAARGNCDFDPH